MPSELDERLASLRRKRDNALQEQGRHDQARAEANARHAQLTSSLKELGFDTPDEASEAADRLEAEARTLADQAEHKIREALGV